MDREWFPYGLRSEASLQERIVQLVHHLIDSFFRIFLNHMCLEVAFISERIESLTSLHPELVRLQHKG